MAESRLVSLGLHGSVTIASTSIYTAQKRAKWHILPVSEVTSFP